MRKPKFRFDDAYEAVYIYSDSAMAYEYAFSFLSAKINKRDAESTMIKKAKRAEATEILAEEEAKSMW